MMAPLQSRLALLPVLPLVPGLEEQDGHHEEETANARRHGGHGGQPARDVLQEVRDIAGELGAAQRKSVNRADDDDDSRTGPSCFAGVSRGLAES